MAQSEHTKIINKCARQVLKPAGLVRKGQSRTWYDDHSWYTTVVEFQPHKWKHGALLNVGVSFHWYEKNYISFDIGYRETGFEAFETAEQFHAAIEAMVNTALEKVLFYRRKLPDLPGAKNMILEHTFSSDSLWGNYHKGVICALTDQPKESERFFRDLLAVEHEVPWAIELKKRTRGLLEILEQPEAFRQHILEIIVQSRLKKKLKSVAFELS